MSPTPRAAGERALRHLFQRPRAGHVPVLEGATLPRVLQLRPAEHGREMEAAASREARARDGGGVSQMVFMTEDGDRVSVVPGDAPGGARVWLDIESEDGTDTASACMTLEQADALIAALTLAMTEARR